jgi:hypothetical protein
MSYKRRGLRYLQKQQAKVNAIERNFAAKSEEIFMKVVKTRRLKERLRVAFKIIFGASKYAKIK